MYILYILGGKKLRVYVYIISYRKRMLVKSSRSRIPTLVGKCKCMEPRCQVCDMLDTRKTYKFREKALPFNLKTVIVILATLTIYSCVTLEITSERHQRNYDLDLIIMKRAIIRDNSRGFPVAVHFNQPDHSLSNLRCVILRGD